MSKGTRVWVAVGKNAIPASAGWYKRDVRRWLNDTFPAGMHYRFTIERYLLVPDPVKPKKPAKRRRPA